MTPPTTALERLIAIHEAEHPCDGALIAEARQEQAELVAKLAAALKELELAREQADCAPRG